VPLHLRALRKAAVAALHSFNHAQALQQQQQHDNIINNSGNAASSDATDAQTDRKGSEAQGQGTAGDGTSGRVGGKVGLELASALNGLELELVAAQRARRRTQVESRVAAREKRRRAELRRLEHDSALEAAQTSAAEAIAKERKAQEQVEALTEQRRQSAALAASASAVSNMCNNNTQGFEICISYNLILFLNERQFILCLVGWYYLRSGTQLLRI